MKKFFTLHLLVTLSFGASHLTHAASPDVAFSKGVLAFHSYRYKDALKLFAKVPPRNGNYEQAIALTALIYKKQEKYSKSRKFFKILLMMNEGRENKKVGSYHYELGNIYFKKKKFKSAKKHLQKSIYYSFNEPASKLLLAQIAIREEEFPKAESYLIEVTNSNLDDLRPSAHSLLAQLYVKTGFRKGSIRHLLAARDSANVRLETPNLAPQSRAINTSALNLAQKWLAPLEGNRFGGSIGIESAYDSNVFLSPEGISASFAGSSGRESFKETLRVSLTYASSPLDKWRWLFSYTGSANYNFSKTTRFGQFWTNNLSFYLTRGMHDKFKYGWKLGLDHGIRYYYDQDSNKERLRSFRLMASTGPFIGYEIIPKWTFGVETFFEPQYFFQDDEASAAFKKSGWVQNVNFFLQPDNAKKYFNPYAGLNVSHRQSTGTEFRSQEYAFSIRNLINLTDRIAIVPNMGITFAHYGSRTAGPRDDFTQNYGISSQFRLSRLFSLKADVTFSKNDSNIDSDYSFNRWFTALTAYYQI